jgi:hypothetical protein
VVVAAVADVAVVAAVVTVRKPLEKKRGIR